MKNKIKLIIKYILLFAQINFLYSMGDSEPDILDDLESRKITELSRAYFDNFNSISFAKDGDYALIITNNTDLALWDFANKSRPSKKDFSLKDKDLESCYIYENDDELIGLAYGSDCSINFLDFTDIANPICKFVGYLRCEKDFKISAEFSLSHDKNYGILGSDEGEIYLWDLSDRLYISEDSISGLKIADCAISVVKWDREGKYVLVGTENGMISVVDVQDKANIQEISSCFFSKSAICAIDWFNNDKYAVVADLKGQVVLLDLKDKKNPKVRQLLIGNDTNFEFWVQISFNPKKNYFLVSQSNLAHETKIRLFYFDKNTKKAKLVAYLNTKTKRIKTLCWTPDGNYAVAADQSSIELWDLEKFIN